MVITRPLGSCELKDAKGPLTSVRVREEKSAMDCDGFDVWSFRDKTKFSKPLTFAATSGTDSRSTAAPIISSFFIFVFLSFYGSSITDYQTYH